MNRKELQDRTKAFAVRVIKMARHLPNDIAGQVVGKQIVRSATSVGANYRAACRGRSRAEFAAKMGTVAEESDETLYWLEITEEAELLASAKLDALKKEAHELTAIFTAGRKTLMEERGRDV